MSHATEVDLETGPDGHRYNDDLLMKDEPRRAAADLHRLVFPVLDHPELRERFVALDSRAGRDKRVARALGFWAVLAALTSLLLGATEPIWGHEWQLPRQLTTVIGGTAAVLGIAAALVAAFGMMHGPRKYEWLRARLRTERIRQFHYQTFLFHLPDVLTVVAARRAAGPNAPPTDAEQEYAARRSDWLKGLAELDRRWAERPPKELIKEVVKWDPDAPPPVWLHARPGGEMGSAEPTYPAAEAAGLDAELDAVFRAYDALRFGEQVGYASYNLRQRNAPAPPTALGSPKRRLDTLERFPGRTLPPRQWRAILTRVWQAAFAVLVLLHFLLLALVLVHPPFEVKPLVLHVGVVDAALVAVAARTLSEGFALTREIERYEEYLAVCSELRRRFWAATSPDEKFRIMVQMERASFEEMREFMRSHLETSFVL